MKRFLARLLSGLLVLSVLLTPVGVHAQEASRAITKLDPPVAVQVTASKVTLQYTEGHQYSKDGTHWQNIAVFTGLKADQSYSFYQRIAGNGQSKSLPATIKTASKRPCSLPPQTPQLEMCESDTIQLVVQQGCEYRMDGGSWRTGATFVWLQPDTEYTFEQRWAETGEELAGEAGAPLVVRTAKGAPTSEMNHDQVMAFIEANGELDEDSNRIVAYSVTDEYGSEYYFYLTKEIDSFTMELLYDGVAASSLAFDLQVELHKTWTTGVMRFNTILVSQNTIVDEAYDIQHLTKKNINDSFVYESEAAGAYLTQEDVSLLGNAGLYALFTFWDEVLYEELGFGFRGLGFTSYNGKGAVSCDLPSSHHVGSYEVRNQRDAGCSASGSLGYRYCINCGHQVEYLGTVQPTASHEYDHACDPDCNNCGAMRRITHSYLFSCAEGCSVCGSLREETYATHTLGEGAVCTLCGEQGRYLGDVTGDGKVNMGDAARLYAHIRGTSLITDPATLAVADTSVDGKLNLGDTARILAHAKGKNPLF